MSAPSSGVDATAIGLRPLQEADRAFVMSLFSAVHAPTLSAAGLGQPAVARLVAMQFLGQTGSYRARFPQARTSILEQGGDPVGRLIVDTEAADLLVIDIAVCPEMQGRGIGGAAVAAVQRDAARAGLGVRALVMPHNGPSLAMFRRRGFVGTGRMAGPSLELRWTA